MPIQTFEFPNYYAIVLAVGKDQVFLLVPSLRFLSFKVGSPCKNKTDLDEKQIFHYILSKTLSGAHRIISILKIPLYDSNSHYDIKRRETSKELFRVYSETRSKKDWTLANIQ